MDPKRRAGMVITQAERKAANDAIGEYFKAGTISIRCPRCGAQFHFKGDVGAGQIECETENCVRLGFRGI